VSSHRFIAGDWGTTRLRLSLCEEDRILETRSGPGIGALTGSPAQIVRELIEPWSSRHGALPLVLCGMVGSRNGWKEVPYVACPASADSLRKALLRFEDGSLNVAIVPGVSCRSPLGAPDVMRGEETQIIGALALRPALARGRRLLCLPGTHTKWVSLEDGVIRSFVTAMTGELFALLRDHSMLARASQPASSGSAPSVAPAPGAAPTAGGAPMASIAAAAPPAGGGAESGFDRALALQSGETHAPLLHALFGTRSRQLIDGVSREWALDFLSGLLIGADVSGAIEVLGGRAQHSSATANGATDASGIGEVTLVGDPMLSALYTRALRAQGLEAVALDGNECSLAGLRALVTTG
jgi:2-dehydro-3-deoxygalactonokinase